MITQSSAVNMDAESGYLVESTVSDGKVVAQATITAFVTPVVKHWLE